MISAGLTRAESSATISVSEELAAERARQRRIMLELRAALLKTVAAIEREYDLKPSESRRA